jgi:hypothetical protein
MGAPMSRSPLAVARAAFVLANKELAKYSDPYSPKIYTQPQLFAILAVKCFFGLDYRGVAHLLADFSDLRKAIKLKSVPHYTTLQKAHQRLLKKGLLTE